MKTCHIAELVCRGTGHTGDILQLGPLRRRPGRRSTLSPTQSELR
jgi:hypothetical protein